MENSGKKCERGTNRNVTLTNATTTTGTGQRANDHYTYYFIYLHKD